MCVCLQVDVVVFATGFNFSFPFLPPDLQAKSGYRLRLYKHVFPPSLTRPTLAVVGFISGLGAIGPLAEMQARWATRVFKGADHTKTMNSLLICLMHTVLKAKPFRNISS